MSLLWKYLLLRLKYLVARDELQALERYRTATEEVKRWNAASEHSSRTAEWIRQQGEGEWSLMISEFRRSLGWTYEGGGKFTRQQ